jgi:DNA-binding NtrC family response regulator
MELASGGTLFLDEVGELAPGVQAKLLRALEAGRIRRVGEVEERPIDVRVIAATNRDLELEVERGAFREDLLYRLDVVRLEVPPLRERLSDLPELFSHFVRVQAEAFGRAPIGVRPEHLAALAAHGWPGNIRELENTAKRAVLLGIDAALEELRRRAARSKPDVAPADAARKPLPLAEALDRAARTAILDALRAAGGSRTRAAALLGVSRKTLFNKMAELGIRSDTQWS